MVRLCSRSSRAASAEAPGVLSVMIFMESGLVGVLFVRGFFVGSWAEASSFFCSEGFSCVSNLIIFLSGSGLFSFCSFGLISGAISEVFWGVIDESF